jgi:peptide/nickel transport system substrate-binding protein
MIDKTGFYTKYLYDGLDYTHIGFNVRSAPLNDKKVREALAYGLDREGFLKSRYGDYGFTLDIPFAQASWAYDKSIKPYKYDPAKAEKLLDEAGWKKGADGFRANDKGEPLTIKFSCWQGTKFADLIVAAVKDNWEKIGVKVDIEQVEFATLSANVFDNQEFQCYVMGWTLSIDPDPTDLYGSAATVKGGFNPGGWSTAESDKLLADGLATSDQAKRAKIYSQWSKIFLDEMPYIMIGSSKAFNVVNVRVKGLEYGTYRTWEYLLHKATLSN